jgi:hypothetical protein
MYHCRFDAETGVAHIWIGGGSPVMREYDMADSVASEFLVASERTGQLRRIEVSDYNNTPPETVGRLMVAIGKAKRDNRLNWLLPVEYLLR